MNLLNFGMKHRESHNAVLRFVAKLCINVEKKKEEEE